MANFINEILANLIWLFHLGVVMFVLFGPFIDNPMYLLLHITLCISLLTHWYSNNNICSLSILEAKLRGVNYTQSFTHSLISPIYDMSKTQWSSITFFVTLVLLCISLYKFYHHRSVREATICYKKNTKASDTFEQKAKVFFECVGNALQM